MSNIPAEIHQTIDIWLAAMVKCCDMRSWGKTLEGAGSPPSLQSGEGNLISSVTIEKLPLLTLGYIIHSDQPMALCDSIKVG